jgi:signal peptidase I
VKADAVRIKAKKEVAVPLGERVKSEIIAWFWVILAFMLINGTLGQARVIPSGSMENTLLIGDHLIMSRIGYDAGIPFTNVHVPLWRNPKRQQIIIFKPPFDPTQPDYVKRVIGLPGDVIDIRDGAVWVNGQRLKESYTLGPSEPAPAGQAPPGYEVTKFPPRKDILGTPVIIYMSLDAPRDAWNGDIGARFEAYLNAIIHPGTVRWRRLFHVF